MARDVSFTPSKSNPLRENPNIALGREHNEIPLSPQLYDGSNGRSSPTLTNRITQENDLRQLEERFNLMLSAVSRTLDDRTQLNAELHQSNQRTQQILHEVSQSNKEAMELFATTMQRIETIESESQLLTSSASTNELLNIQKEAIAETPTSETSPYFVDPKILDILNKPSICSQIGSLFTSFLDAISDFFSSLLRTIIKFFTGE